MEKNDIGKRIKKIREYLSLNQEQFAKKLKISQSAISSYEKELRNPPDSILKLIANEFNINYDYILHGNGPMLLNDTINNIHLNDDKAILLDELCKAYSLTDTSKHIIQTYLYMPENHKQIINDFIDIIKKMK